MPIVSGGGGGSGLPLTGGTLTGPLVLRPSNKDAVPLQIKPVAGATADDTNFLELYDDTAALMSSVSGQGRVDLEGATGAGAGLLDMNPGSSARIKVDVGGFVRLQDHAGAALFAVQDGVAGYASRAGVAGALATTTFVSGTGKQVDTTADRELIVPVTYNPTAGAAATCTVALSPDNVTYSTLGVETEPAGIAFDGTIHLLRLLVPAAWYVKLTVVNATLGTATYY